MSHCIRSSLVFWTLSCAVASAQRVYWEPNAGSLAFEQTSTLQLVFENCAPEGDPKLPSLDGLDLQFTISESSFAMVNMSVTRKRILNFDARPTKRPEVRIPAFDVATDKGAQHVEAATFAIGNATVGRTAIPLETAASARLTPAEGAFWAGEVFSVTYTLDVAERFNPRNPGSVMWKPAPLSVEDWLQPEHFSSTSGGEPRVGLIYKARGYIATPGSYQIPAASQEIVLVINTSGNLLFPFSAPDMVKHTVTSNEPSLTIKPLPDGAPADFAGAVGQFTLTSKVVPTAVGVGEPITWTLNLSGTGNWPDVHGLPAREVSKDFKVLQPQAKRTPVEGKLFDATLAEDVVLIPTKAGTYTLAPVSYSYFDPRKGTYETAQTEGMTVTVTPAGTGEPNSRPLFVPPSVTAQPAAPTASAFTPQLAGPPVPPAAIPRDPLRGSDTGWVPLHAWAWNLWLLASVIWLIPAWLILSALRSRQTDPLQPQRDARRRLAQILSSLPAASNAAARVDALHAWQRDAAALLDIPHAAPTPAILARHSGIPDATAAAGPDGDRWARLWADADRALYGRENILPGDWLVRAEAALEATRVPGWQASSLFLPRNLLPWFAGFQARFSRPETGVIVSAIVLLLLFSAIRPPVFAATEEEQASAPKPSKYYAGPLDAYNAGDFGAAEQGWRDTVARQPADWVARHNLGLALAQQGHWPEAAAQWTSAFLLDPRDESVRWHLGLGFERADYTPPGFAEFALASGPHLLARLASPAEWQWLLVGAGFVLATGLLLLLVRAYRNLSNGWTRPAAFAAIALAFVVILAAVMSLHFYGETTDPNVAIAWHQVLLRSIPTEADTQQKTSSLPAGSLGIVNHEYVGWVRLVFANGQTGWVRQQDIVWLYRQR
jgi:tetratricopeptide (TPR) repeat protein